MQILSQNHQLHQPAVFPVPAKRAGERPAINSFRLAGNSAFTLIELLVVIAIIGLLVALGIPAIKGMSKSNAMAAADRQLLDDLAYARQRAIADHTTVYMVFIPSNIVDTTRFIMPADPVIGQSIVRLYGSQFNTYAMMTLRSVGDQPGRSFAHYLTGWRSLPESIFIAPDKFVSTNTIPPFAYANAFPFPLVTNSAVVTPSPFLPYIAFDYLGRLVNAQGQTRNQDEVIPLVHGSIFYVRDANGTLLSQPADVQEKPPGNTIYNNPINAGARFPYYPSNAFNQLHIDWLTGRARVEKFEIQ